MRLDGEEEVYFFTMMLFIIDKFKIGMCEASRVVRFPPYLACT